MFEWIFAKTLDRDINLILDIYYLNIGIKL